MRLFELTNNLDLTEGLSPVLYHATGVDNLFNILHSNEFNLAPAFDQGKDTEMNKDKLYYMSTARSTTSDFIHRRAEPGMAVLELDGRKLQQRYKGAAVDFFGVPEDHEMEDRIMSDKPVIPNATEYITSIHIYPGMTTPQKLTYIKQQAETANIPVHFYDNGKDLVNLNTRNSINSATPEIKDSYSYIFDDNAPVEMFNWNQLFTNSKDELSDEALRALKALHDKDAVSKLNTSLSNSSDPGLKGKAANESRSNLEQFYRHARKNNLKTAKDIVKFLRNKWSIGLFKQLLSRITK